MDSDAIKREEARLSRALNGRRASQSNFDVKKIQTEPTSPKPTSPKPTSPIMNEKRDSKWSPKPIDEEQKRRIKEAEERERKREQEKKDLDASQRGLLRNIQKNDSFRGLTPFEAQEEKKKIDTRMNKDGFWKTEQDRLNQQAGIAREKLAGVINTKVGNDNKEEDESRAKLDQLVKKHAEAKRKTDDAFRTVEARRNSVSAPEPPKFIQNRPNRAATLSSHQLDIDLEELDRIAASFDYLKFVPYEDEKLQVIRNASVKVKSQLADRLQFDPQIFLVSIKEISKTTTLLEKKEEEKANKLAQAAVALVKSSLAGSLSENEFELYAELIRSALNSIHQAFKL